MPKQKRPFQVEIEAKVTVLAFDEASARRKVERALADGRTLGTDVEATGAVWTYATTPTTSPALPAGRPLTSHDHAAEHGQKSRITTSSPAPP